MTSEQLTQELQKILGNNLESVVLYGSSTADDQTARFSDINLLVVSKDWSVPVMKLLQPLLKKWVKKGNLPPLFITTDHIRDSVDVFPIEYLDIQASRRVLFGADPFEKISIDTLNLQHQLEYELRGKLLQLRARFFETDGNDEALSEVMGKSLSTFSVLFKAALRLMKKDVPGKRRDIWLELNKYVPVDVEALEAIWDYREKKGNLISPEIVFSRLIKTVEAVIDFVDHYKEKESL